MSRVQITTVQHWFMWRHCPEKATSNYRSPWWRSSWGYFQAHISAVFSDIFKMQRIHVLTSIGDWPWNFKSIFDVNSKMCLHCGGERHRMKYNTASWMNHTFRCLYEMRIRWKRKNIDLDYTVNSIAWIKWTFNEYIQSNLAFIWEINHIYDTCLLASPWFLNAICL